MCPLGDEEKHSRDDSRKSNLNVDLSNANTQKIDSQFSPGGVFKGDGTDDLQYFTNTMPIDDTSLLEDAFETQWVNLAGETQVIDLGGETQVLDDLDCMKNLTADLLNECNTEIASVSDSEETNETEVLCDTQEVSQDDSVNIDGIRESVVDSYSRKQADNVSGAPFSTGEHHSGSVCRTFTSIRAASIRASGLAARARGVNGNLYSNSSVISSLEQRKSEQVSSFLVEDVSKLCMKNNEKRLWHDEEGEGLRNTNPCKAGITVARKLFMEDEAGEVGQSEADMKHTDDNLDMPELLATENCLGGLSYAESQEPGELSQANALEVVDRFLELNVEYDQGFDLRVPKEKEKVVSGAKGSRDLAKRSIIQSTNGVFGVFDWDDTCEDERGGEFFLKKKELFFDKGGSKRRYLTEPRKRRCSDHKSIKPVEDHGHEEQTLNKKKFGESVHSDPGLMLHKLRAKGKSLHCGEEVFHKNLAQDLDEQIDLASGHKSSDNDINKDIPDVNNIGPDTQIAAEAMETLCFEVHLPDNNKIGPNKGARETKKAPKRNQSSNKAALLEKSLTEQCPASVGVVTRQAKQTKRTRANSSNDFSHSLIKQSKNARTGHGTELKETEQSEKKSCLQDQLDFVVPVAHRTRKCRKLNCSKDAENSVDDMEKMNNDKMNTPALGKKRKSAKDKKIQIITLEKLRSLRSSGFKQSNVNNVRTSSVLNVDALKHPKGKRTRQEMLSVEQEDASRWSMRLKRSRTIDASISSNPGRNHDQSSKSALSSLDRKTLLQQTVDNERSTVDSDHHVNVKSILNNANEVSISMQFEGKGHPEGTKANGRLETSPSERSKTSFLTCTTPANCATPVHNKSPICMGDEYHKQSCRKNLSRMSLTKELNNLVSGSPGPFGATKEARKRREITNVRVLFSQHLDVDVTKQQNKILARLGAAVASSMSDATHFVADEFVRTRNMLEAIAFSKPVVTHLWLQSCGQASCLIDEKNYILRDMKKEKEFGFSMPVSLSRASEHPLLQGQKVLVTPNTKPGKDILANLIKAVHGLAVERLGRSVLKESKLPDDLLILSCEEDYEICVPFLEKGGIIYSSELLLNGIVKQKLEYERHRLFADHVKSTRSTIWVKKKNQFLPVAKCK